LETLLLAIAQYGLVFLFTSVLVEQLGAPIPAYPVLMLTGALAARGEFNVAVLLAVAVLACLIADTAWYVAGKWYGRRVLRALCRVSLTPDGCVRQTEMIFTRWGAPSLVVAKFIPGFASVATALAGQLRIGRAQFLFFDAIGATAWALGGLALGWLFAPAIEDIVGLLSSLGKWGVGILFAAVGLFVASKWWQRHRFERQLRMNRMSVQTLAGLVDAGKAPVIVDARSEISRAEGRIPGAVFLVGYALPPHLQSLAKDEAIVVYCACPNDASAVLAARKLMELGYRQVWPLQGGVEAWIASGRKLDSVPQAQ
jgi:membrane protein DedA with SNARE-associated domain/rhodanese-related sulfurtransferase